MFNNGYCPILAFAGKNYEGITNISSDLCCNAIYDAQDSCTCLYDHLYDKQGFVDGS